MEDNCMLQNNEVGGGEKRNDPCPFCALSSHEILDENEYALAVRDRCPVTKGHSLIIPRRHVSDYFQLSKEEREGAFALLDRVKAAIDHDLQPDGYNIGMNIGEAAGQKIFHLHIHLIPRKKGASGVARGTVKGVIRHMMSY